MHTDLAPPTLLLWRKAGAISGWCAIGIGCCCRSQGGCLCSLSTLQLRQLLQNLPYKGGLGLLHLRRRSLGTHTLATHCLARATGGRLSGRLRLTIPTLHRYCLVGLTVALTLARYCL